TSWICGPGSTTRRPGLVTRYRLILIRDCLRVSQSSGFILKSCGNASERSPVEASLSMIEWLNGLKEESYEDSKKLHVDSISAAGIGYDRPSARCIDANSGCTSSRDLQSGWSSSHYFSHGTRRAVRGPWQFRQDAPGSIQCGWHVAL